MYYPAVNIYTTKRQHQQIPLTSCVWVSLPSIKYASALKKCPQVIGITHLKQKHYKLPSVSQIISSGHLIHYAFGHFLQMPPKIPETVLFSQESQQAVMPRAVTSLLTAPQLLLIQTIPMFFQRSFFSKYVSLPTNKCCREYCLDK